MKTKKNKLVPLVTGNLVRCSTIVNNYSEVDGGGLVFTPREIGVCRVTLFTTRSADVQYLYTDEDGKICDGTRVVLRTTITEATKEDILQHPLAWVAQLQQIRENAEEGVFDDDPYMGVEDDEVWFPVEQKETT